MGSSPEGSFEFEMQRFMQVGCMASPQMACMQLLQTALHVPSQTTPMNPLLRQLPLMYPDLPNTCAPPVCSASGGLVNGHGKQLCYTAFNKSQEVLKMCEVE